MSVLNPQFAEGFTISSYAIPAGDSKILAVGIVIEDNTPGTVTSVKHNGVDLTFRHAVQLVTTFGSRIEIWDLQLGSTTPAGDIVVTVSETVSGIITCAVTVTDVKQQSPEVVQSATSTSSPINTSITTITNDAVIIDAFCTNSTASITITQGPDQVEDIAHNDTAAGVAGGMSHRVGGAAGSYTLGWVGVTRLCHALLAYEVAVGGVTGKSNPLSGPFGGPFAGPIG